MDSDSDFDISDDEDFMQKLRQKRMTEVKQVQSQKPRMKQKDEHVYISGPYKLVTLRGPDNSTFQLFGEYHEAGNQCGAIESSLSIFEFLDKYFRFNKRKIIDFYFEIFDLYGYNNKESSKKVAVYKKLEPRDNANLIVARNKLLSCFYPLVKDRCKYENVRFHAADIRQSINPVAYKLAQKIKYSQLQTKEYWKKFRKDNEKDILILQQLSKMNCKQYSNYVFNTLKPYIKQLFNLKMTDRLIIVIKKGILNLCTENCDKKVWKIKSQRLSNLELLYDVITGKKNPSDFTRQTYTDLIQIQDDFFHDIWIAIKMLIGNQPHKIFYGGGAHVDNLVCLLTSSFGYKVEHINEDHPKINGVEYRNCLRINLKR